MAKTNDIKNDVNNVDLDNDVGVQVNTSPIINLGSELKEMKNVNDVLVVNHDCKTNRNLGSDIKGVGHHHLSYL